MIKRFRRTWGLINDRIFVFGWPIPLMCVCVCDVENSFLKYHRYHSTHDTAKHQWQENDQHYAHIYFEARTKIMGSFSNICLTLAKDRAQLLEWLFEDENETLCKFDACHRAYLCFSLFRVCVCVFLFVYIRRENNCVWLCASPMSAVMRDIVCCRLSPN